MKAVAGAFFVFILISDGHADLLHQSPATAVERETRIGFLDTVGDAAYIAAGAAWDAVGRISLNGGICTGTLVSATKVLSAAHCVDDDANDVLDPGVLDGAAFLLGDDLGVSSTVLPIASVDFNIWGGDASKDLAIFTLAAPTNVVTPMTFSYQDPSGLVGTSVGYGAHGDGASFADDLDGKGRAMNNMVDFVGVDGGDMFDTIQADFDSPAQNTNTLGSAMPLALEGSTAGGDSGGPLFVDFGDGHGQVIVGTLNAGFNPFGDPSEYGDVSIWTRLANPTNQTLLANHGLSAVPEPSSFCLGMLLACFAIGHRNRPKATVHRVV